MCIASRECADKSVCVAGRCQLDKPTVKPAVDTARRVVVRPADVAFISRSERDAASGTVPSSFALGRDGGRLLLRFSVAIPASATVVEAYVVLRRSTLVDDDPAPVSLHATRIVDAWSSGSVSWAFQPRQTEHRAPSTTVQPSGPRLVRLDVRDLVRQWPRRDPQDQGIAVVAETESRTGMTFALTALGDGSLSSGERSGELGTRPSVSSAAPDVAPYLELYLR